MGAVDATDSWPIAPMKAVPGELPTGGDWMHEPKWDGHRALVRVRGDAIEVASSNGKSRLASWSWMPAIRACLAHDDVIVDGEVVAMDEAGQHRFGYIGDPTKAHAMILFDILRVGGEGLLGRPWVERRGVLEQVFTPGGQFSITPVSADGALLWDVIVSSGYEGIVSKRLDGTYLPGKRTSTWRKVKWRHVQEFVVGGWLPGAGRREGTLGSLLLGVHDGGGVLRYVGGVGSGFGDDDLDEARSRARGGRDCDMPVHAGPTADRQLEGALVCPDLRRAGRVRRVDERRAVAPSRLPRLPRRRRCPRRDGHTLSAVCGAMPAGTSRSMAKDLVDEPAGPFSHDGHRPIQITRDDRGVIKVAGELDLVGGPLLDEAVQACEREGGPVAIDMSEVTFVDSSGLRALIAAVQRAGREGRRVKLVSPTTVVTRLLDITATTPMFDID